MSGQRTGGDLAVRMPERGVGEIGALERSFTHMAGSLGLAATSWAGLTHSSGNSAGLSTVRWRLSGAGRELSREATVAGVSGPQFRGEGEGDAVQCGPCLARCCHFGQQ
jgi:hypothetical protein